MCQEYEPPELTEIGPVEDVTGGSDPTLEGDNTQPSAGTPNTATPTSVLS